MIRIVRGYRKDMHSVRMVTAEKGIMRECHESEEKVISLVKRNAERRNQSFNLNLSLLSGKTRSKSVISMAHEMQEHRFGR